MADGSARVARTYLPRPAQGTSLQRLVEATLPTFYSESERTLPNGLPKFVKKELDAFVSCGDFARGFVQLKCEACPRGRFVAFSCKTRGFCPSCGGRRMTELSAHLVDSVFPRVPVRQFVLTVPFELRAKMAYDAAFAAEVKRALHASIQAAFARRANARGESHARTGGITAIQRFGSGMNLHVHFHALVLDGVFAGDPRDEHAMRFQDGHRWSARDAGLVLADLVGRLVHRGVIDFAADVRAELEQLAETDPLGVASCMHRIALGPRRGQRVERVGAQERGGLRAGAVELDSKRPKARYAGFDLEASVRIAANDRAALERLCRYLLRPPLAEKRLRFRDDGKVAVELKSRWRDGTTHLVFTPLELVEKAAALIPRPHTNLLVYHGVLAANAKGRTAVVAHGRVANGAEVAQSSSQRIIATATPTPAGPKPRSRSPRDWATLMKRGLGLDVLECPDCGARMRIRALIDDPRIAQPFAAKLGLVRTRAGPADLPDTSLLETTFEPDPDFVDYTED